MNSVSNDFKQEMAKGNQRYLRFADITLTDGTVLNLTNAQIWSGGFKIEEATSADNVFQIGALVVGKLTLTLNNMYGDYTDVDFDKAEVVAYIALELEDGTTSEKVRKGFYTVHDASGFNSSLVTLECYDSASKFAKPYSESSLVYPASLATILRDACSVCEVSLATTNFTGNDYVVQTRPTDENLTFGDVVSDVAQIACKYAKMNSAGQLYLGWYSEFNDNDAHEITSLYSDNIALDDVVITGVRVTTTNKDDPESSLYGEVGYVIGVENNSLVEIGQAEAVAKLIGDKIIGFRFRPLSVSMVSNPIIEAGDKAYVTDRKGNRYLTYITRNVFSPGSEQEISCEAETPARNSATAYSESTKIYINVRKMLQKHKTDFEVALNNLADRVASSNGYYVTEVTQEDGSKIVYSHNHPTLEESDIIWKETAETRSVSTDGGKTWTAGITADGDAVLRVLSAEGISASWITTGVFEVRDDEGKIIFLADKDSGRVYVNSNFVAISKETGEETSLTDTINEMDGDIKKKVETWHQPDDPSELWDEYVDEILLDNEGNPILDHKGREIYTRFWVGLQNHKGDIWEDTANNIEYYWDGGEWVKTISETKAEAIFAVLDGEIIAQVVAGNIINAINISKESVRIDASTYVDINGVVSANDYFKINSDGSFETIRGKIGNILIDTDKLYTTGHDSINSTTAGFMFGADGQISIGDENNFLKFFKTVKNEEEKWTADVKLDKLTIELADNLVIGTSRAATKAENDEAMKYATNYLYFDSEVGLVVSETGTPSGNADNPYNTRVSVDGIEFRSRERVLSSINGSGYILYRPSGTVKMMELDSEALKFYKNGEDVVAQYSSTGFEAYEGRIGRGDTAFIIDSRSIHNGTLGESNSVWISTGSSDAAVIAGSEEISGWALAMGNTFGVTRNGRLYATQANISGKLIAGANSEIGAWKITDGALTLYETTENEQTGEETTSVVASIGRSGIRIRDTFSVSQAGKLNATGAYIQGEVHAASGTFEGTVKASEGYFSAELRSPHGEIGGWTLSDRRLYSGSPGSGVFLSPGGFGADEEAVTICGTASRNWTIGSGSTFGVTRDGKMYCKSGYIANWEIKQNELESTTGTNTVALRSGSSDSTKAIQVTNDGTDNFYVTYGGQMVTNKAILGGITLADNSIYSSGHNRVSSSTAGFLMNSDGEFSIGDNSSYLRFYKDSNNQWKLDISASALKFGGNTPVTDATAGNKTWTTQPTPPYKVGDIYINSTGDGTVKYCTTARDSGSYTESDWSDSPSVKQATSYIHADSSGLHISNNGRNYTSGNHIDIDANYLKFSRGNVTRATLSSDKFIFYRSDGYKAMELTDTSLSFYKPQTTTAAAIINSDGIEVKSGKIGNITITSSSIYSGEHSSVSSTKNGFYLDDNGNFSLYNKPTIGTTTYFNFRAASSSLSIKAKSFYLGDYGTEESFIKFTTNGASGMRVGCLSVSTSRVTIKTTAHASGSPVLGYRVDPDTFSDGTDNYKIDVSDSSSKRYKNHVRNMTFEEAKAILDITPVWFQFKDGYLAEDDEFVGKTVPGLYAEDVGEHFPMAIFHNNEGQIENYKDRHLLSAMLMIIKHQQQEIEALKKER